jgi:hypothetical protein
MSALLGIVRDGRVEFASPTRLPEGSRVWVQPAEEDDGFLTDETWPTSSEGINELIHRMENFEPLVLTSDDEARIAAARASVRDVSIAAARKQMGL